MRALTPSILIAAALVACGSDKPAPPARGEPEPATAVPPAAAADAGAPSAIGDPGPEPPAGDGALMQEPFDAEEFEASRPPETGQDGVVKEGARFEDQNGANVVVLVHQIEGGGSGGPNSRRLWAFHYIDEGGKRRMLRKLADKEENCELDNAAGWVDGSLQISDVDRDGLGEVTFAYDLGCRGDVSPKTRKLVVLEDGKKWILRGESRVDVGGGEKVGGAFVADPAATKWPKKVHEHAVAAWGRLVEK
jgi:hypothetical protein